MEALPATGQSIYFWMFRQGLKHIPWDEIVQAIASSKHMIREKDRANYWRGYYKSDLYTGKHNVSMLNPGQEQKIRPFDTMKYSEYPIHPYLNQPEIDNRYVPCNNQGIPLIKWSKGCYPKADALAWPGCVYLGENLKGTKLIVIDIDGDHNNQLWTKTIKAFEPYRLLTHTLTKPTSDNSITSYHLTFSVDRIIPTMHFTNAHIDIIGNKMNSIRYFKNKQWNNIAPLQMTDEIWEGIKNRIKVLEEIDYGNICKSK